MGDKRQVEFKFNEMKLWYYTHWGGYDLPIDLQNAIKKAQPRWDDESYCFRIILSQLIGESWDSETGCGLAPYNIDSEYNDFLVDIVNKSVTFIGQVYTFEEFISLDIDSENWM